jgi:hypothetical protein
VQTQGGPVHLADGRGQPFRLPGPRIAHSQAILRVPDEWAHSMSTACVLSGLGRLVVLKPYDSNSQIIDGIVAKRRYCDFRWAHIVVCGAFDP